MLVAAPSPPRRVSAGCASSGVALHPREHQGCRCCAQVIGDEDPGVQDRFPHERGQTRLDLLADVGRYRRRCGDPAQYGREGELAMVGEMPVERSAQPILLLYLDNGVDLRYGSTADQGRTEEKIPPLGCGAQHEHRAPTQSEAHQLGTARWACVRRGKCLSDAEATFHCAIMHAW